MFKKTNIWKGYFEKPNKFRHLGILLTSKQEQRKDFDAEEKFADALSQLTNKLVIQVHRVIRYYICTKSGCKTKNCRNNSKDDIKKDRWKRTKKQNYLCYKMEHCVKELPKQSPGRCVYSLYTFSMGHNKYSF